MESMIFIYFEGQKKRKEILKIDDESEKYLNDVDGSGKIWRYDKADKAMSTKLSQVQKEFSGFWEARKSGSGMNRLRSTCR